MINKEKKHFSVLICVCCIMPCSDGVFQCSAGFTKKFFLLLTMVAILISQFRENISSFNFLADTLDTSHCSKCDQASDMWQQLELASEFESDLRDNADWGRKWVVDFSAEKAELIGLRTLVLLMRKWRGLLLRKIHLLRCWG